MGHTCNYAITHAYDASLENKGVNTMGYVWLCTILSSPFHSSLDHSRPFLLPVLPFLLQPFGCNTALVASARPGPALLQGGTGYLWDPTRSVRRPCQTGPGECERAGKPRGSRDPLLRSLGWFGSRSSDIHPGRSPRVSKTCWVTRVESTSMSFWLSKPEIRTPVCS